MCTAEPSGRDAPSTAPPLPSPHRRRGAHTIFRASLLRADGDSSVGDRPRAQTPVDRTRAVAAAVRGRDCRVDGWVGGVYKDRWRAVSGHGRGADGRKRADRSRMSPSPAPQRRARRCSAHTTGVRAHTYCNNITRPYRTAVRRTVVVVAVAIVEEPINKIIAVILSRVSCFPTVRSRVGYSSR